LAIQNGGEIEDVFGLSAGAAFDQAGIWAGKAGRTYFTSGSEWLLLLQRVAFVAALIFLAVLAVRAVRANPGAWVLVLWCVVPVAVFVAAGLWTYLSYYAILFPAHFLVLGAVAERLRRPAIIAGAVLVAANVWFMADCYRFLSRYGGAQGTYGTGLGYKVAAARYLAERADVPELVRQQRMGQMDQLGRLELPQLDLPWLAGLEKARLGGSLALPTNVMVIVVDENRTSYDVARVAQLANLPQTNFGPVRLYFMERP